MKHQVIVSFGRAKDFEFHFSSGDLVGRTADEARQWFGHEFDIMRCDVATPTGKILVVDRILSVAKYAGEERFREQSTWASQFARNTALLLGREVIRVDVAGYAIGY